MGPAGCVSSASLISEGGQQLCKWLCREGWVWGQHSAPSVDPAGSSLRRLQVLDAECVKAGDSDC